MQSGVPFSFSRYNAFISRMEAHMGILTRKMISAALALAFTAALSTSLFAQGAPPQSSAGQPYTIEYY